MSIDSEAAHLFKQWQAQQQALSGINKIIQPQANQMSTDQSPHLAQQSAFPQGPDQSPANPVNSVRPMGTPISKDKQTKPSYDPNACRQCGTMHPPLPAGAKCPNASIISSTEKDAGLSDVFINKTLVDLRNIILAQMASKKVKDGKKFFQYAIVELTKSLEQYNE